MGKDLKGKELGNGITQRKDGRYMARFTVDGKTHTIYEFDLNTLKKKFSEKKHLYETFSFEVLVQVFVFFTAGKCYDLCSYVCTQFLLAGAVFDINIYAQLAVFESDELQRNDISSLMQ